MSKVRTWKVDKTLLERRKMLSAEATRLIENIRDNYNGMLSENFYTIRLLAKIPDDVQVELDEKTGKLIEILQEEESEEDEQIN